MAWSGELMCGVVIWMPWDHQHYAVLLSLKAGLE